MLKESLTMFVLRAISASFSGVISLVLNLAGIGCLLMPFSTPWRAVGFVAIVLIQILLVRMFHLSLFVIPWFDQMPHWEVDKFHTAVLAGYFVALIILWILFLGNFQVF